MSDLQNRMTAADRFSRAQAMARIPGSPIINKHVEMMQSQRGGVAIKNETSLADITSGSEMYEFFTGGSAAGMSVTEQTAMTVSAVYASVNLIAGAISSIPLHVYERDGDNRKRVEHDFAWLLNYEPNPSWSAPVFWEYKTSSLLLLGDTFTRILRPGRRSPGVTGFKPYHKSRVTVIKEKDRLWYRLLNDDGTTEVIDQDDMIHVPGPGFNGLNGQSQIRYSLKSSAGIALAADQFSADFFENGARPDFALEIPGKVDEADKNMLRDTWAERHKGMGNNHKPALLAGGMKVHELSMKAEDAQLIATRRFQVEDIARIFGVPPHMIGHTEKTTSWGSGVEQMSIGFVKYTLMRHLVKFQQELNRKLFTGSDHKKYYFEFKTAGLERGDIKTRYEAYRIALGRAGEPGWATPNEIRKLENQEPLDDGNNRYTGEKSNEATS